jgi:hypothetical protein
LDYNYKSIRGSLAQQLAKGLLQFVGHNGLWAIRDLRPFLDICAQPKNHGGMFAKALYPRMASQEFLYTRLVTTTLERVLLLTSKIGKAR